MTKTTQDEFIPKKMRDFLTEEIECHVCHQKVARDYMDRHLNLHAADLLD